MHEETLFKALSADNRIPWEKSAEHFMYMKLASGGLLSDEVDLLIKTAEGTISPEDIQKAMDQGTLTGVRSSVAQDITSNAKHQRTHGERLGKGVGTLAGIGGGLLTSKGKGHSIGEKAFRAAVGMAVGHQAGKVVGQELDAHRLNKRGSMEKDALSLAGHGALMGGLGGAAVGAGLGALSDPEHRGRNALIGAASGGMLGGVGGAGLGRAADLDADLFKINKYHNARLTVDALRAEMGLTGSRTTKMDPETLRHAEMGLFGGRSSAPKVIHPKGDVIDPPESAIKKLSEVNRDKVAGVLGQIGGWALKNPRMAAGVAGAGLGAITGAAGAAGDPNASMLGGALKGGLVGGGLGAAGAHFGMKAMAKGGRKAILNVPGKGALSIAPKLNEAGGLAPGALNFRPAPAVMTPKVAAAILKQAMIKEGWSLRNLFKAVPEIVPPEDVGEAAISGGIQEGPAGAINEAAGQAGALAGHALGERFHVPALGAMAGNMGAKGLSGQLTEGMEAPKTAAATKLLSAIHGLKKVAEEPRGGLSTTDEEAPTGPNEFSGNQYPINHNEMGAAPEAEPVANIDQDLQPDPADAIMALLQKGNESEFHEARADEAQQAASAAEERASMLEGQMQQLLQEIDQVKQEQGGQAQMASEQAMMSSQDAMAARTESQAAQQQVMQLRQAITSYRQQLMDLLAQDPTMDAGPPPVPVGPAPGAPGMEGAAGGPEGQAMPPGGGSQPQEVPAEAAGAAPPAQVALAGGEAPKAPEAPKPPAAEGGGVNVNIHPPKAAKPAAKA
jgi:hypothetical protein